MTQRHCSKISEAPFHSASHREADVRLKPVVDHRPAAVRCLKALIVARRWPRAALLSMGLAAALVACGGGGGEEPPPGNPPPVGGPPPSGNVIPADCAEPGTGSGPSTSGSEAPSTIGSTIDVYANCNTVYAGQRMTFHLSDHAGSAATRNASVTIFRVGVTDEVVLNSTASMTKQTVPNDAWVNCCDWPVGLTLQVPLDWQSGYYRARFTSPSGGQPAWLSFVVKTRTPAADTNMVFQVPFDTAQAYNPWGGKSAYEFNSSNGVRAQALSMFRPSLDAAGEEYIVGVVSYIRWAESRGIKMDYITSDDLHEDPKALDPYKVFLTVGHDEYWTQTMRDALDAHIDGGDHAIIMSGNTMWWRIRRVTDDYGRALGKTLIERQSGTAGANWFEFDREGRTIGANFFKGGFINSGTAPAAQLERNYTVYDSAHWAFAGTGLANGSEFGGQYQIHSYESDGVDYTFVGPKPVPTGGDGVPTDTKILALTSLPAAEWDSPSENPASAPQITLTGVPGPNAAMTEFTRPSGGIVFNFGTTDYDRVLPTCTGASATQTPECRIASNVINYLRNN